jgi:hypothetical protein
MHLRIVGEGGMIYFFFFFLRKMRLLKLRINRNKIDRGYSPMYNIYRGVGRGSVREKRGVA